jgi:hypothetical protein
MDYPDTSDKSPPLSPNPSPSHQVNKTLNEIAHDQLINLYLNLISAKIKTYTNNDLRQRIHHLKEWICDDWDDTPATFSLFDNTSDFSDWEKATTGGTVTTKTP